MILGLFTLTITISAFLLFLIQPMIAKLIMPHLGGAPTVWNTAMLFFQACLLLGYAYAHAGAKWLSIGNHMRMHGVLLALSLLCMPLALVVPDLDAAHQPIVWTLSALAFSVGFPFLMLSSSAPLLQHWFAHSGHRLAANPYPLYAASNVGSFAALLSFPLLVEPLLFSGQQMLGWSWGYGCYIVLVVCCMLRIGRHTQPIPAAPQAAPVQPLRATQWLYWIALAAVPSSLMLGVTSYISTDIAAVPLLWIMPLALYLLTFIFAFGGGKSLYHACQRVYLPTVLLLLLLVMSRGSFNLGVFLAHLFGFFVIAMMCHGRMNECKPHASQLTQFYLCMAIGGVLGGLLNGLLAPVLFNDIYEYPLMLIAAAILYPCYKWRGLHRRSLLWLNGFVLCLLVFYGLHDQITHSEWHQAITNGVEGKRGLDWFIYLALIATGATLLRHSLVAFTGILVVIYGMHLHIERVDGLMRERNFFGVSQVVYEEDTNANAYYHGTTIHGVQSRDEAMRLAPISYYGALKEVYASVPDTLNQLPIAVVGMGMGTVQCYAKPDQHVDYFEIDPIVLRIAEDRDYFTYLSDCPGEYKVYLGDGRVEIAKMDNQRYGLIVLDAYSSDSLPVHLITQEAVAIYKAKLQPGGLLAFNITNRHMNLRPILSAIAQDLGLQVYVKDFSSEHPLSYNSTWVVMSENSDALDAMRSHYDEWLTIGQRTKRSWRDDYSNILHALTLTQGWYLPQPAQGQ